MKVYVITRGWYSDYGIVAIFSTRKLAEEFLKHPGVEDANDIDEWELDPLKRVARGYFQYSVALCRNGDLYICIKNDYRGDCGSEEKLVFETACVRGGKLHAWFTVLAKNDTQAIKIANERRTMLLANTPCRTTKKMVETPTP